MSILLHNISFPPEGEDAIGLFLRWDGTVHLWRPHAFIGHDVEATELPTHGRLIDGDVAEVIHFTEEDADGKDFYDGILYAADFISKQPTIVPAEEGET